LKKNNGRPYKPNTDAGLTGIAWQIVDDWADANCNDANSNVVMMDWLAAASNDPGGSSWFASKKLITDISNLNATEVEEAEIAATQSPLLDAALISYILNDLVLVELTV
jgi:hypothetical protein